MAWTNFWICLLFGWLGVHKFREKKTGIGILYLLTLGLFFIGWIYDTIRYLMVAISGRDKGESVSSAGKVLGENEPLPVALGHGLLLKPGEICHYYAEATSIKLKTGVTGYSGGSSGVSVRVAKGVSYRTGQRRATPVRGVIQEKFPGWLGVTNKRIIFNSAQGSFDKPIEKISSMNLLDDGIIFQFGEKQYMIETENPKYIHQIVSRVFRDSENQ